MSSLLATVDVGNLYHTSLGQGKTLGDFISVILIGSFSLAGIGILVLFILAGISIIRGAGSGNPDDTAKGKKAATAAIIGAGIVFFSYFIVRIIELIFGTTFITNPGI